MATATQRPPRPLRGSRLSAFYPTQSKTEPSLAAFDSAFQIQEYISLLVARNPHDVETIVTIPEKSRLGGIEDEAGDVKGESAVDENCWIYEQLRRLAQDLTHPLITSLQQECTRTTCPEMKAGEWQYLCVAHGSEGAMEQCCAIDYILHTTDSATALLNSPRAFPSRLSVPQSSIRHFSSLARRLSRIFAHAYFSHREVFEQAEAESSLYARFLSLSSKYNLVPAEFLVVPARMAQAGIGPVASSSKATLDRGNSMEPSRNNTTGLENKDQGMTRSASAKYTADSKEPPSILQPTGRDASPGDPLSPKRFGRSRTDTMIHSDVAAFQESHGTGLGLDLPVPPSKGKAKEAAPPETVEPKAAQAPLNKPIEKDSDPGLRSIDDVSIRDFIPQKAVVFADVEVKHQEAEADADNLDDFEAIPISPAKEPVQAEVVQSPSRPSHFVLLAASDAVCEITAVDVSQISPPIAPVIPPQEPAPAKTESTLAPIEISEDEAEVQKPEVKEQELPETKADSTDETGEFVVLSRAEDTTLVDESTSQDITTASTSEAPIEQQPLKTDDKIEEETPAPVAVPEESDVGEGDVSTSETETEVEPTPEPAPVPEVEVETTAEPVPEPTPTAPVAEPKPDPIPETKPADEPEEPSTTEETQNEPEVDEADEVDPNKTLEEDLTDVEKALKE